MLSAKIEPLFIKHNSKQKNSKLIKKISLLVGALLSTLVLIGIVLIFLYAIGKLINSFQVESCFIKLLINIFSVPCKFKTCSANATCINQLFFAKCKCNSGFQGNGIDCDGKINY